MTLEYLEGYRRDGVRVDYLRFKHNFFSQNGEDGILQEILPKITADTETKWCVEFGAWDGKHMSNTFNLVSNFDWNAVYIEGNPNYFNLLKSTVLNHQRIIPIFRMISHHRESGDSLDNILRSTPLPVDFHILSIDIDS